MARLIYLGLLLLVTVGFALVQFRTRPGTALRMAAGWVLIFTGILAIYGLWPHLRDTISSSAVMISENQIQVPIRRDGHAYLTAEVNGSNVRFVVDTGASLVALTRKDAERLGLEPDKLIYYDKANTANGVVATAPVTIDTLRIGDFTGRNIKAVVIDGDLGISLLGMEYLRQFARVSFERDRLLLEW